MSRKSDYLQIRVTPGQKAALRRQAQHAGLGISAYVLDRLLPPARLRFDELLSAIGSEEDQRFALAELNDLLAGLAPAELMEAVAAPPRLDGLSPYLRNYVAAMVEQVSHHHGATPPGWLAELEPLDEPHFATPLSGLRLHLLAAAPVPFRRRNIFVDTGVGDRV
jgi:uncharacterized protein (DUF1778 family)